MDGEVQTDDRVQASAVMQAGESQLVDVVQQVSEVGRAGDVMQIPDLEQVDEFPEVGSLMLQASIVLKSFSNLHYFE